ncbi:alpha/beta fold hydrolase [Halohasta litorea]|uniref:Alpha/beta fold hydrolase n=1 Tax=Halohasta litorea TaxID=869891 RepID=A0ABD6D715_9EURY|nr:alpha/beta hydrolase [Halohasta litorea]
MQQNDPTALSDGVDTAGPDDARSIVFVHGAVFTRKMWAPQREALADEFHVVTPDLPGHGTRADGSFELESAVELLDRVVEAETDGRPLIVGLSLGGYVATEYVSHHPQRADGVVLSGCSANPVDGMGLLTRATGGVTRLATRSDRITRFVENRAADWVRKRDITEAHKAEIIDSGFYPKQFGNAGPQLAGRDFRAALASYPGPSLVLNGERDYVMRRGEDAHAEAAQQGRVEVIENVGHVANLHRPTAYTNTIREFISRTVSA